MFTGLVETLGTIKEVATNKEGRTIRVLSPIAKELQIDDSVAVNGCCQTVIERTDNEFLVQAVHVTLEKTTLGELKSGDEVNLELAMRASDRLGGHLVQGHVNAVTELSSIKEIGKNWEIWFKVPQGQGKYIVKEGSICIEGISLTVADLTDDEFMVTIIPHTYEKTNLKHKRSGSRVNIEVDILAKYIERLLAPYGNNKSKIDSSFLKDNGFA